MQSFYADTCIYLNLWKKEVDENGKPLWLFAKKFFELADLEGFRIFYSGFILKEMLFLLSSGEYLEKRAFIEENRIFERASLNEEEYKKAIELKNKTPTNCSLFDIIHLLLAKKTNSILVTQDRELLDLADYYTLIAKTPQEIINY
jgi:predicted nucleic acid-binding protein